MIFETPLRQELRCSAAPIGSGSQARPQSRCCGCSDLKALPGTTRFIHAGRRNALGALKPVDPTLCVTAGVKILPGRWSTVDHTVRLEAATRTRMHWDLS